MSHIQQFVEMKGADRGLGYWSEQAFEAVHADFKQSWDSVKVDIDHPDYLSKLLSCITRWNARNI